MTTNTDLSVANYSLINVLKFSLYPGASDSSISLVLDYCAAAKLDPMLKPVHIVPMYNKLAQCMVDTIMPGIGLYRIQASRSGECAGISEPIFGEDFTATIGSCTITYPKTCKVIVKRLLPNGELAEFSAIERWEENYATKSRNEPEPNAMWARRPYGQLAKCAEAQALRKAFPEIGSAPTAEEMEGKELEIQATVIDSQPKVLSLPAYSDERFNLKLESYSEKIKAGANAQEIIDFLSSKYLLSSKQIATLNNIKNNSGE